MPRCVTRRRVKESPGNAHTETGKPGSPNTGGPASTAGNLAMYNSYIMKRTQIYLDEGQEDELSRRAAAEGLTKSALIRRAVDAYLDDAGDEELRLARFKAAVEVVAGAAPDLPPGALYVERLRELDIQRQEEIERRRRA